PSISPRLRSNERLLTACTPPKRFAIPSTFNNASLITVSCRGSKTGFLTFMMTTYRLFAPDQTRSQLLQGMQKPFGQIQHGQYQYQTINGQMQANELPTQISTCYFCNRREEEGTQERPKHRALATNN